MGNQETKIDPNVMKLVTYFMLFGMVVGMSLVLIGLGKLVRVI